MAAASVSTAASQAFNTAIDAAVARLRKEHGDNVDRIIADPASLDDMLDVAQCELQKETHKGSKRAKAINTVVSFAKLVDSYGKALDVYVNKSPEVASLVWGSCRVVLKITLSYAEVLEKLATTLQKIEENISRFQRYKVLLASSVQMQQALGLVYGDIFEFTLECALYLKRSAIRNFLTTIVKNWDTRFDTVVSRVRQHMELVDDEAWVAFLERALPTLPDGRNIRSELEGIRNWLLPPNREANYLELDSAKFSSPRVSGTCEWFQSEWDSICSSNQNASLLLITGDPGVGKSILSAWIMEQAMKRSVACNGVVLKFHIHEAFAANRSIFDLRRAFALQLLQSRTGDSTVFDGFLGIQKKSALSHATEAFSDEIWTTACSIIDGVDDVAFIIDGLDELTYPHHEAPKLLQHLEMVATIRESKNLKFKCLVTSRPPQYGLSAEWKIRPFRPQDTARDIETFIEEELQQSKEITRSEPDQRKQVVSQIVAVANGMFLWTKFILRDILKQRTMNRIFETIQKFPAGLSKTYESLLGRVDLQDEDVRRLFEWTLCSTRPLSLLELGEVLSTELGEDELITRAMTVEEDIKQKCGPLISILDGFASITHLSAAQFLLSETITAQTGIFEALCHREVALRSLAYLSMPIEKLPLVEQLFIHADDEIRQTWSAIQTNHRLIGYASNNWINHLQKSDLIRADLPLDELELDGISEVMEILSPYSQQLAWMENIDLSKAVNLEKALDEQKLALRIRELILGPIHLDVIQNVLNLARLHESLNQHAKAAPFYRRAWEFSKNNFDERQQIAFACADKLVTSMEMSGSSLETAEITSWIWQTRSDTLGPTTDEALAAGSKLSWTYLRHQQFDSALDLDRKLFDVTANGLGRLHNQTLQAAETLTKTLQLCGKTDEILPVHRQVWDAVRATASVDENLKIRSMLGLVHALEQSSQRGEVEQLLQQLMDERPSDTPCETDFYLEAALELAKLIQRDGRQKDSIALLKAEWRKFDLMLSKRSNQAGTIDLKYPKAYIVELSNMGEFRIAISISSTLREYLARVEGLDSTSTIIQTLGLSEVYTRSGNRRKAEVVLRKCFNDCLTLNKPELSSAITAGENIALKYQEQDAWGSASFIWGKLLALLWPTFSKDDNPALPNPNRQNAIDIARRYALSISKSKSSSAAAVIMYKKLYFACQTSLGFDNDKTLQILKEFGGYLRSTNDFSQIEVIYETYYRTCQEKYGEQDPRTLEAGKDFGGILRSTSASSIDPAGFSKAENLYKSLIKLAQARWGEDHEETMQLSIALADVLKLQEKNALGTRKLQRAWESIVNQKDSDSKSAKRSRATVGSIQELHRQLDKIYKSQNNKCMLKKQQEQFAAVLVRIQAEDPALAPTIAQSLVEEGLLQNAVDVYSGIILRDGAKTARLGTLTTLSYLFKRPSDPRLILDTKLFPIVQRKALESEFIAETSRSILFLLLRAFNTKESFTIAFDMVHKELKIAGRTHLQFPDLASTECRPFSGAAQTRLLRIYLERNDKESLTKAFNILQEERSIIELRGYSAAEAGAKRRDVAESDALNVLLEYWFELGTYEALALISGVLEDETNRDEGAKIFPQQALVSRFAEQTISRGRLDQLSVVAKAMLQRTKSPFSITSTRLTVIPLIEAYLDSEDWDHLDDIWAQLKNRPDSDICIAVTELLAKSHASNDRREKLLSTLVAFDRAYRHAERGISVDSKRQITLKQICTAPGVDAANELMVIQAIEVLDNYHRTMGYKTLVLFILWHYVEHDLLDKIPYWNPSWERFDTPAIVKPIMEKLIEWVKTNPQVCHEIVAAGDTGSLFTHSLTIARWELDPKRSETGPNQSDSITTPFDTLYNIQALAMRLDKSYSIKVVSLAFTTANLLEQIAEDKPVRAQFQLGVNAIREKYVQQFLNQQPEHPFGYNLMIRSILRQQHHTAVILRGLHQAALLPDALHSKTLLETGHDIARHIEKHSSSSEIQQIQQLAVEVMKYVFQQCFKRLPLDTLLTYNVLKDLVRLWKAQHSTEFFALRKLYRSIWEGVPPTWTTRALSCIGLLVSLDAFESGRRHDALSIALRISSHDELTYGWEEQTFDSWNVVSYYYSASNEHEQAYKIHSRILPMAQRCFPSSALSRRVHQQTNLLGRALQRMRCWLEAQKVYKDLWVLCSTKPEDWMYRKLGNMSWREIETARRALKREMQVAGPLSQFVGDMEGSDARSDFHQDVCAGGLRGYLAGPVNEKAAFWEFSWQLD